MSHIPAQHSIATSVAVKEYAEEVHMATWAADVEDKQLRCNTPVEGDATSKVGDFDDEDALVDMCQWQIGEISTACMHQRRLLKDTCQERAQYSKAFRHH